MMERGRPRPQNCLPAIGFDFTRPVGKTGVFVSLIAAGGDARAPNKSAFNAARIVIISRHARARVDGGRQVRPRDAKRCGVVLHSLATETRAACRAPACTD